jgi:hypothetical protein
MRSSEASVAPAGPLPMMPTVLMVVLIKTGILVYDPVVNKKLSAFSGPASQSENGFAARRRNHRLTRFR